MLSGLAAQAQTYDSLWKLKRMERDLRHQLKREENESALQLRQIDQDKLHLSLNPLGVLFDFIDTNITLGAEYYLTPKVSVRADMGYIYHSAYYVKAIKARGFIFRPMIRLYSMRKARSSFDLSFHYKYVKSTQDDWLGRLPVNGVPSYSEFTEFDIIRSRWGVMLFYNYRTRRFANNRCYVEFYWGVGLKSRVNVYLKDQPKSIYRLIEDSGPSSLQTIPTLQMGLRVVYKFPHDLFQKAKLKKTNYGKRNEGVQ